MKKFMIFVTVLFSIAAMAENIEATVVSNKINHRIESNLDFGGKVYYNCWDVEDKADIVLEELGAEDVDVDCYGGIDDSLPSYAWDANIHATFKSLKYGQDKLVEGVNAEWKEVHLRDFDGCHLMNEFVEAFFENFETKDFESKGGCFRPGDRYDIKLKVLVRK